MKKHIIVLGIIMSAAVHAQTIDFNHFDEEKMNQVLFSKMKDYTKSNYSSPLVQTNIGKERIYRFIKKNCDNLSLEELNAKINIKLLRKWDSRAISQTDLLGNVGMISSMDCQNIKTYQELAGRCITGWLNSENLIFIKWSQIAEATTFYNRRTREVFVLWAYYN